MEILTALISVEIIASKFLASYISTYRTEHPYEEKNPLLRLLSKKFDLDHDEWLSFFCTVFLVIFSVYLLNTIFTGAAYHFLFVFTGFFTTMLNLGAAHSSYFRRTNFITRKLLR